MLSFFRWAAILILLFVLLMSGYYLYFNVINRPPAEVHTVSRGTAVSAVYGTVTITSTYQLAMFAQNSGYLHYGPELKGTAVTLNGNVVKKDMLLGTVVDEIGQRTLENARRDHEAALSRQQVGPSNAGPLQSAQSKLDALKRLPEKSYPKVDFDAAVNEVNRLTSAVNTERLNFQHDVDTTSSILKSAEDQLKRTEVRAPFDGILTVINYNDNAYVLANQALFTVASAATYVSGEVNEGRRGSVAQGDESGNQTVFLWQPNLRRHAGRSTACPKCREFPLHGHTRSRQTAGQPALRPDRRDECHPREKAERRPRAGARGEHRPGPYCRRRHRRAAHAQERDFAAWNTSKLSKA